MAVPRYECGKAKNMEADFHIWDEEAHRPKYWLQMVQLYLQARFLAVDTGEGGEEKMISHFSNNALRF